MQAHDAKQAAVGAGTRMPSWMPEILRSGRMTRTPLIMQSEQHECALAALAMIAGHHGRHVDLPTLRLLNPAGLRGADLRQTLSLAESLGLHGRPLRLEPEELCELRLPAILHWGLDHFVVLIKVGWRQITILDPAQGRRVVPWKEAANYITGVALELMPGPDFERGGSIPRMRFRDFWTRSTGLLGNIVGVLVLSLALQLFALTSPLYMQLVVDEALVKHDEPLLKVLVLAFGAVMLLRSAINWVRARLVLHAGHAISFQTSSNLLHHLLRLPLPWFERRHLGDVVSRFASLAPVQGVLTEGLAVAVVDAIMALTTLIMLLLYSGKLTLVVLAALLLYVALRLMTIPVFRRLQQASIATAAREETVFLETLRCIQTLKAHGREQDRHMHWQNRHADTVNAQVAQGRFSLNLGTVNDVLMGLENLLVVYLGAGMVLAGDFTVGMLYAFMSFKGQFTGRMLALADGIAGLAVLRLHMERLADIGYEAPETQPSLAPRPQQKQVDISLENLAFTYEKHLPPVFDKLSAELPAGSLTLISGASGCGKTTLLRVLCGLLPATGGTLRIDAAPLSDYGLGVWRQRNAVVLQDDQLFTGTLAENLTFFDVSPDTQRLDQCAAATGFAEIVHNLPLGWQTRIGETGLGMSGGQRQRLLLARALYGNPDALFIDEGTSHLDAEAARFIAELIRRLPMTRVVVTHHPELFPEPDVHLHFSAPGEVQALTCSS